MKKIDRVKAALRQLGEWSTAEEVAEKSGLPRTEAVAWLSVARYRKEVRATEASGQWRYKWLD